ncbi:beta-glucanase (GH16 family) [Allocatelliglobosispora scoriae]|uniref:Beta-glucanase (GH16 family) n=1 Tax=Allocatelliglobosispora scoriae TaxID=643052 RepID=A0A841BJB3_9ACTN|nr:glycoside hydrolase family 16 protein [Allocatelliglobosispora scoriae]MBB5867715.1 beta-glucanase (GH16 family) [Allocatelliglobosispora scoriae]
MSSGTTSASPVLTAVANPAPVWADEFDGPAGSPPDPTRWVFELGGGGWGNRERQHYTAEPRNACLDGRGNLVISAHRDEIPGSRRGPRWAYTSARLTTAGTFAQTYGRFEARIALPHGMGIWPAFWLLAEDTRAPLRRADRWPHSGEIDIMESLGHRAHRIFGGLHGPGYSGGRSLTAEHAVSRRHTPSKPRFHVFAVDWTPTSISWSADGVRYARRTPGDLAGRKWVFDRPFFMVLNLAVGGRWPGDPDHSTVFPQRLTVDYVRVFTSAAADPECSDEARGP